MKCIEKNGKKETYICVPKEYVLNDTHFFDKNLSSMFFFVYCSIDRWRTYHFGESYYKSSIVNLLEDIGRPFDYKKNSKVSNLSNDIIYALEYMERIGMIGLIKGNYHDVFKQFVIKIHEKQFVSGDIVQLSVSSFDFVLNSKSNINKGRLLHVLLYALSPIIREQSINPVNYDIEYIYFNVYAESNQQTSKRIGISDKTIGLCLATLSGREKDNRPLIVYEPPRGIYHEYHKYIPKIYTENSEGWRERIHSELDYFKNRLEKEKKTNQTENNNDIDYDDLW